MPDSHAPDAYQALWDAMAWQERLAVIPGTFAASRWFGVEAIPTLTLCRMHGHPGLWGETKATFKAIGGSPFDLEKEVDKAVRPVPTEPGGDRSHPRRGAVAAAAAAGRPAPRLSPAPRLGAVPGVCRACV